jgi:hypothetical protein
VPVKQAQHLRPLYVYTLHVPERGVGGEGMGSVAVGE